MQEHNKAPVPDITKAIKEMKQLYYYRLSHPYNMDLKKMYGPYTPQIITTNELNQILNLRYFITPGSSFLGTCGSGEQALFAYLFGAKNNVFFDISYNAYWLTCLKIGAIKAFDKHTEYEQFVQDLKENSGQFGDLLKVPNIWHVLSYLSDVQIKYFENMCNARMYILTRNRTCQFYNINQKDYDILKNSVELPIPFIHTDIRNLDEKLNDKKFHNIYLSNILCWVEPYEVEPILEKIKKHINPGGNLFLMTDCFELDNMWKAATNVYSLPEYEVCVLPEQDDIYQIIVKHEQSIGR